MFFARVWVASSAGLTKLGTAALAEFCGDAGAGDKGECCSGCCGRGGGGCGTDGGGSTFTKSRMVSGARGASTGGTTFSSGGSAGAAAASCGVDRGHVPGPRDLRRGLRGDVERAHAHEHDRRGAGGQARYSLTPGNNDERAELAAADSWW